MKTIITILACSLFLVGCGSRELQQGTSSVGFTVGSTRDAIVAQLEQIDATILTDSPDRLLAEVKAVESKRPMQVELAFADGKLARVNYIPQ